MDTNLLPTGALHPGRGHPVSSGQSGPAASGGEPAPTGSSRTVTAGVEITISADAQSFLAGAESSDGSGRSGLSPAHVARSSQFRALAVETYKNFGQLVSAIARRLEDSGTEEPQAADETAALPATDEAEEPAAEEPAAEGVAAEQPAAAEGEEDAGANAAAEPDGAVAEGAEPAGETDGLAAEPGIVVEADGLEDTLLEVLDESGSETA